MKTRILYISICLCAVYYMTVSPLYYDAGHAYSWINGYPQSCQCVATGQLSSNCNLFKCTCVCDIFAGKCDYGCCCDVDCESSQINRFKVLGVCLDEGYTPNVENVCYSSDELQRVNPKPPMTGSSTSKAAIDALLCVQKTNTAFQGEFFDNVPLQKSLIFSTSTGQKAFSYPDTGLSLSQVPADHFYDQNDSIPAFWLSDSGNVVPFGLGYFPLPLPDDQGICIDQNYVQFEQVVAPTSCVRTMDCSSLAAFQASYTAWSATLGRDSLIGVQISHVHYQDFMSGQTINVTDSWLGSSTACRTMFVQSNASSGFDPELCGVSLEMLSLSSSMLSMKTHFPTCFGAVLSVDYNFVHDQSTYSPIRYITANIIITNVPFETCSEATQTEHFKQSYSVSFSELPARNKTGNNDDGNVIKRKRSGNPGYLVGNPVIYGIHSSNVTSRTVSEYSEGFTIPSTLSSYDVGDPSSFGTSTCPKLTQNISTAAMSIAFGKDVSTGCVVQLDRVELMNMCCVGTDTCSGSYTSQYVSASGIPLFLTPNSGLIGIYGNADPLDLTQWEQIAIPVNSVSRRWDDVRGTCSNMLTGLDYKFLLAYSGEKAHPQIKIVAVAGSYSFSDWVFRWPSDYSSQKQTFPLTITVSFTYMNGISLQPYSLPAPPILFKVPYDVFFPFSISSSPSPYTLNSIILSFIAIVLVIITVCN